MRGYLNGKLTNHQNAKLSFYQKSVNMVLADWPVLLLGLELNILGQSSVQNYLLTNEK